MKKSLIIIGMLISFCSISFANEKLVKVQLSENIKGAEFLFACPSIRVWLQKNGLEYSSGQSLMGEFRLSQIKYLRKIQESNYFSLGIGEAAYDSLATKYSENLLFLSFGMEQSPLFYDWLVANLELGYILSTVKSFSGDQSLYPSSGKVYLSIGVGFNILI